MSDAEIKEGSRVCVAGVPAFCGTVKRITDGVATVSFDNWEGHGIRLLEELTASEVPEPKVVFSLNTKAVLQGAVHQMYSFKLQDNGCLRISRDWADGREIPVVLGRVEDASADGVMTPSILALLGYISHVCYFPSDACDHISQALATVASKLEAASPWPQYIIDDAARLGMTPEALWAEFKEWQQARDANS